MRVDAGKVSNAALQKLAERRAQQGLETPLAEESVEIPTDLLWIWEAYGDLQRCRPRGFGPAAIPYAEIESYCRLRQLGTEDTEEIVRLIQKMDDCWLEWASKKTPGSGK